MHNLKNLKHIFAIWTILIVLILGLVRWLGNDMIVPWTHLLIYRDAPIQNMIYSYHWKPSIDKIVMVKIDDISLNTLQSQSNQKILNIPKEKYINLIQKLNQVGVRWIAFDIVFANKDPQEQDFANTMKDAKNVVIAAALNEHNFSCIADEWSDIRTCSGIPRSVYKDVPWGSINLSWVSDRRNIVTDISWKEYGSWKSNTMIDTLPLALYRISGGVYTGTLSPDRYYMNPFFGNPNTYPSISFSDVLGMSKVDLVRNFADKYVFIGENGTLIHDEVVSPVSDTMMAWVETHAHMLDGLLQNRLQSQLEVETLYMLVVIIGLMAVILYFYIPHIYAPIVAFWLMIFAIWLGRYLLFTYNIVFDILPILLSIWLFSFPLTFIYRFFIVDRERRKLQRNFGHYVDPRVVEEIAGKGENIKLWWEHREVTVMFSDIAGFTTISEKLSTTDLFWLMTAYLSRMTNILIEAGGTLDKYIGDAVMGFFWAPLLLPDHAIRSCETALAMRKALPSFNAEIATRWLDPIDFRVGIATGDVMVGNIGSEERFNYTVLGDTVNLASRLEGTGKEYDVHIILSHGTRMQLDDRFYLRELDTIAVKGKTEWIRIYELIGYRAEIDAPYFYEQYEKALTLYRNAQYREAGIIWEKQAEQDPPSRIMMLRCLSLVRGETHLENGVYHMTHK